MTSHLSLSYEVTQRRFFLHYVERRATIVYILIGVTQDHKVQWKVSSNISLLTLGSSFISPKALDQCWPIKI